MQASPNKFGGRQFYLRQCMEKATYLERQKRIRGRYDRVKLMRLHAKHWQELSPAERQVFEKQAIAERSRMFVDHALAVEAHLDDGALLRSRADAAEREAEPANKLSNSSCLQNDALELCCRKLSSGQYRKAQVQELSKQRGTCPAAVSTERMQQMQAQSSICVQSAMVVPEWVRRVGKVRHEFSQAIFLVHMHDQERYFRFLFASLRPTYLLLMPLTLLETSAPSERACGSTWEADLLQALSQQWMYDAGQFFQQINSGVYQETASGSCYTAHLVGPATSSQLMCLCHCSLCLMVLSSMLTPPLVALAPRVTRLPPRAKHPRTASSCGSTLGCERCWVSR